FTRHSRGFLYYHSEPHAASLEGSVRFRITPDGTPASFLRGQDLLAPWALPWQITLLQIARFPKYARIQEQILRENLAKEGQLAHCRNIFRERISPQWMLFRLDSPFAVNFSAQISSPPFAARNLQESLTWSGTLHSSSYQPSSWTSLLGSAVARFEPSTRPEHAGRRVIHLHIVKIAAPVACTAKGRMLEPKEGQLLTVSDNRRAPAPWRYDIDRKTDAAFALRVLWNKSGLP
ncbi:hypothetical protein C8R44DRAFT_654200, partial [Mycena epipterygia]